MKRQRGFILYAALGALAVIAVMGVALKVQSSRLDAANDRLDAYKTAGESAKREAERITKLDKERKDKADAENKRTTDRLRADIKRLRDGSVTSGGSVSPSPAGSVCPQGQVCYDRAEYQRADGDFVKGARGLSDEGSQIAVDFDTVWKWANP